MKILITGGYGFIGSHVADRFYKEGHEIYIIDNLSSGNKDNVKIKHKSFILDIEDKQCEEVFRAVGFDVVIHLAAQVDVSQSIIDPYVDAKTNILGLINVLDLSVKYEVKKLIFASSAAVYGNQSNISFDEQSDTKPKSPYGISKLIGEYYCQKWYEIYGLKTICFRFSNVYGPRQGINSEAGVLSIFLKKVLNNENLVVYGDGEQTRDFIYVEDLVDGIYKGALNNTTKGVYNLSTNTEKSVNDVINAINNLYKVKSINYTDRREGDILNSKLDNSKALNELGWTPKYSFEEGLSKTFTWYKNNKNNQDSKSKKGNVKKKNNLRKIFSKFIPYVENIGIFIILLIYSLKDFGITSNNDQLIIYLSIAYIGLIGVLYGQKQSIIATVLSITLYILNFLNIGGDIVILFYEPKHLIILSLFILVGIITGYTIDKKNREIYSIKLDLAATNEKYDFLYKVYNETKSVKDILQKQIINSKDSFGKIYSIVERLKHLDMEKVFNGSIEVIEEIMNTKKVAIYTIGSNSDFLRLKAKSGTLDFDIPNSIDLKKSLEIRKMIDGKDIYINKALIDGLPILSSPIVNNNQVVAIVALYDVSFENLTLYYQNLFKILISLITDSLSRAILYEESTVSGRYIEGTNILTYIEFEKVIDIMKEKQEKFNMSYLILKINNKEGLIDISNKILPAIRAEDYIGLGKDNNVYLALSNAQLNHIDGIYKRMEKCGLEVTLIEGEEYAS